MKWLAVVAALSAAPVLANPVQEMWGATSCEAVRDALDFDPDSDISDAEYVEKLSLMVSANSFIHGYAVANGWHEVDGFDYISEFRETCAAYPARAPLMILIHLF